jgi:hypothetical protein
LRVSREADDFHFLADLAPYPRSIRPVTTVPRPWIENTSSIGIRNGLSIARSRQRDVLVDRVHQLVDRSLPTAASPFERAESASTRHNRQIVARELVAR